MWKVSSLARSAVNTAGPGAARVLGGRLYSQDAPSGVPYNKSYEADASGESVPAHADVVIVGGGVAGCSTLYHLAKYGVKNAVLLEKHALTAGTTWHTAGLVFSLRPSDLDVELLKMSQDLMTSLEAETGVHPGWINNGGLFVATNKERLDEYKRLAVLGKAYGVNSEVLGPEETKKLYPLMNVEDVYGSLYSPSDGTIDPAQYCDALTRAARKNGAKVIQGCDVTNVQVKEDDYGTKRVIGVETDRGTIKTSCVVNAAGVWSPYIGDMANVKVPLIALRHAYVVTEKIDGIRNMPNVRDHDESLYLKLQGDTLCVGGYEPNPIFWDNVPKDFAFSLVDLDWDVFLFNMEAAMKRVPVIETTGIRSTVCGPESFTPDHKPLLGESPEVRGFYFGCAFNSSGMMLSGGVGSELAKWIINGKPDLDMYNYDIRRFTTKLTDNKKWLKERSQEAYAKNYSIVFPHDEPLASRNMRKDALYDVLIDAGCVFQERQGWERPGWFSPKGPAPALDYDFYGFYDHAKHEPYPYNDRLQEDYTFDFPAHHDIIGKDCLTCRESAAVFDMSYFGNFYLVGPDAQKAVDWIFTNDMQKPPGSTVYTCMLNKNGGVEGDLIVSVLEPGSGGPHTPSFDGRGFYVTIGGAVAQHGYSHMLDIIQDKKWDCQLVDHSDDIGLISVQGPQSRNILQQLTDTDLSEEAFPFSTHKIATMAGHEVRAQRLSFVGELGWEIHVSNSSAVPVYKAIMEAGRQHGVCNAGYRALDALSIEKGYRLWHADVRADDTPLEAGLAFTCKLKTDIDFVGRSAIEAQKKSGMKKRVACFTLDKHVRLQGLETIYRDDVVVGFLRRADYAYALGKSIGYGYVLNPEGDKVTLKYLREGSYTIDVLGERVPANVHTKTPFDPDNKRVKGIYDEPLPIHC